MGRIAPRHATALVALVGALVYASTLGHDFVWDDRYNVVDNEAIRDLGNVPSFFVEPWGARAEAAGTRALNTSYWRPVALTSYAIDHALFGLNPAGFHATNVLLHALACALVVLLGLRLFPDPGADRRGVVLGGLLFAVHPVHTEAVDVITYRTDLLAAVFYAAALVAWRDPAGGRSRRRERLAVFGAAPLLYALGVASKEMAATLPLAAALLDVLAPPRRLGGVERAGRLAPLAVVLVGYLAVRAALLEPTPYRYFAGEPPHVVAFTMMSVFLLYVRRLVWPWPLNPFYDWSVLPPVSSLLAPRALGGAGLLVGWLAVVGVLWRRRPRMAFLLALFPLMLLPVSHVVPIPVAAGERFLYLASAGPLLAASLALARWLAEPRVRRVVLAAVGSAVVAGFAGLTMRRNVDWRSDRAILEANVRDWPQSFNAWYGLAKLHERQGRLEKARRIYDRLGRTEDLQRLRRREGDEPDGDP